MTRAKIRAGLERMILIDILLRMTRSLGIAQTDLKIDDLYVVYSESEQFPLDDWIHAAGLQDLVQGEREG